MISILILCTLLFPVPLLIGYLFRNTDSDTRSVPFFWVSGQVLLWAVFQLLCVPFILLEQPFSRVVKYYNLITVILLGFSLILLLITHGSRKYKKQRPFFQNIFQIPHTKTHCVLWGIFGLLLVFQLVMTVFFAYEEGDDAFYVAISTITADSDTMYLKLPYTGGTTGLDARHGLAPFPIWIAYLAKISGVTAVTVAQIVAPVFLIVIAYSIYYLLGQKLLAKQSRYLPFFLILTELLTIWGGYSIYSAENFVLVRTAQGKAVMANIILPFLLLLLIILLTKIHEHAKTGFSCWLLLALTAVAGCLCSTLGTILTCMLLGIVGLCTVFSYRRFRILFPLAACCLLPFGYALLYFIIKLTE